jgi:hypothetical protein
MLLTVQSSGDGSILASNFATGSVSITFTFPSSGAYFIGLGFLSAFVSAPYQLGVTCGSSNSNGSCVFTSTISIGSSVSGQLTASDAACGDQNGYAKAYRLPVIAGDVFEVTYAATYPASLEVSGPRTPDDTGTWRSSTRSTVTIDYIAPASGDVTVWSMSNTTTPVTGSFTVQVSRLADPCRRRAVKH